ncbi:hypothetical protein G9A89_007615 [Geosiphon pyriformis]|nr:hypothetical protein G9A89_007615 [Geosiphon pyriformis]
MKRQITRFLSNDHGSIFSLTVLSHFLLALSDTNTLIIWNHKLGELYSEIQFDSSFTLSTIVHPHTYLDKILLGSTQGTMQIWNIRTNKIIYSFASFGSPITCLTQSPVVDVIAIGLLDGTIILHHIKADERITTYSQEGHVTSISFRTDDLHIMATANIYGDIALWDLEKKSLFHLMKGAHDGLIPSIQFLNGQPILITSGNDNSVKEWIFDGTDGLPRMLKSRSGHHAPPTTIRYCDNNGHFILSAARDKSLRAFSVVRDSQSVELSQGSLSKKSKNLELKHDDMKLPQIIHISYAGSKQLEWDNIISCHLNTYGARTWSFHKKAIGNHVFVPLDGSNAKVATISPCGNHGFIGSSNGYIDMFNMQSGQHKKSFGGTGKHSRSITGLACDPLNRYLISSSLDGTVKIWDIQTATLTNTIIIASPITNLQLKTDSNLLAIVSDDLCIRVIDVETYKIIREFWGHRNRITDITYNSDGRWIVSSSLDSTIRTWDLPSGHMIDVFQVDSVATSVTFSPTGDFLATSHVDNVGIFLWANRAQFSNISLRSVSDEESFKISLPTTSGVDSDVEENLMDEMEKLDIKTSFASPEQLTEEMITLSTLPKLKWLNLLNLEIIKKRNKPKEPPKIPEKAPFFLATLPGVNPKFVTGPVNEFQVKSNDKDVTKIIKSSKELRIETELTLILKKCEPLRDYSEFFDFMKSLNPSAIDFEFRSVNLDDNFQNLRLFLTAIESRIASKKDFELCEAYLNHFLKIYGDLIVENPDGLGNQLRSILDTHQKEWSRVEELLHYNSCMIEFFRK